MALDEIANIAPINIPNFMADSGGRGIQLAIVSHGLGQLRERWGEQGAQIISDTAGCKVFLPGITDTALLKAASGCAGRRHSARSARSGSAGTTSVIRRCCGSCPAATGC